MFIIFAVIIAISFLTFMRIGKIEERHNMCYEKCDKQSCSVCIDKEQCRPDVV